MPMRFKFCATLFAIFMLIGLSQNFSFFGNTFDIFLVLGVMLVLVILALWPNASRTDRVDRAVAGTTWADKIEFKNPPTD